jgi:hypothetical protein
LRLWRTVVLVAFALACGARTSIEDHRAGRGSFGGTRGHVPATGGFAADGGDVATGGAIGTGGTASALGSTCLEILTAGDSVGDGQYFIDWEGKGPIEVYCDMTLAGGGFTRCLSFVNTPAEDVTDNSWFDRCVDWTMSPTTGNEVLLKLRAWNGVLAYWATGTRAGDWTYDKLTSQKDPGQQLPGTQVPVVLSTGDLLSIPGRSSNNAGCYGGWGNGYEVLVSKPPSAEWPFLSVMPYLHQNGTSAGSPRWFWSSWSPAHEVTFWTDARGLPVAAPDPCTPNLNAPAYSGEFEFYVR